jgi:uncharacterized protein YebE (UPF0316 family)
LGSLQHVSDQNVFNAQEIILHPNIKRVDETLTNNIGLIVLSSSVEFSDFIRPVCLWTFSDDLNLIKNLPIYAVGYGYDEDGMVTNVRMHAKVTLMDQNVCEQKYSTWYKNFFSENKAFCVIGDENGSPCDFDNCLFVKFNGKWYLRGILLRTISYSERICAVGPSHPFLSHDIATNIRWIEDNIESEHEEGDNFTQKPTSVAIKSYDECGIMSSPSGLIQNGKFSSRSEFPWMASIIISSNSFNSSGALISRKHVVTEARVVGFWNDDKTELIAVETSRIKIYLGSLQHVSDQNDFNAQEIILHPNMKWIDGTPTNAIGIIVLSTSVEFSDFIRPVCLWTFSDDLNLIKNLPIYAVGYGRDENGSKTNVRKHAKVTLMDQNMCEEKYSHVKNFFNENKSFCVIGDKNGSPCAYDDCLFVKFNEKWYLRGILLRMIVNTDGSCFVGSSNPFLYHDIATNIKWIENIITK